MLIMTHPPLLGLKVECEMSPSISGGLPKKSKQWEPAHSDQGEESHPMNKLRILHLVQDDKTGLPTESSCIIDTKILLSKQGIFISLALIWGNAVGRFSKEGFRMWVSRGGLFGQFRPFALLSKQLRGRAAGLFTHHLVLVTCCFYCLTKFLLPFSTSCYS